MKAVGGIGIAVVCCAAIAAVAATATAAANGAVMGGKAVIAVESVMIISEVCAILVVTLAKIENDSKKKKPKDKNGWVDLISVCCNHNGNPQNGSIHFHSDAALTGHICAIRAIYFHDTLIKYRLEESQKLETAKIICASAV